MMTDKLKDRIRSRYGPWALITGASSGIGEELAWRLAESGVNLIVNARRERRLLRVAQNIQSNYPIEVRVVAGDMGCQDQREKVLDISAEYDVGLLVVAAGFGTSGKFLNSNLQEELSMLEVNCRAPLIRGIILFSSILALQGVPWASHYAATKAYIQSLAEALHIEFYPYGVDILSAAPGPVHTGFADRADMEMGSALEPSQIALPILKALGRKTTVYPGLLTKILTSSLSLLPRWGKVKVMQQVMAGMTRHQRA